MKSRISTRRNFHLFLILVISFLFLFVAQYKVTAAEDYLRTEDGKEHEIYAFNQPRGPDQLIAYTSEYGQRTGTNPWGAEAIVENGKVVELRHGFLSQESDSPIPEKGFVLSGHGTAKEWLTSNLEKGMNVELIQKERTKVGILVSGYNLNWYNQMGLESPDWAFFQEMKNLVQLVRNQGYKIVTLSDQDLEDAYKSASDLDRKTFAHLSELKTLILPNTRRMSRKEVQNVRRYVQNGGTVLGFMQASYRDESDKKTENENYQLGDLFGISYDSFSWEQGKHSYISKTEDHEIWQGLDDSVKNDRGWAMINSPTSGGRVLGVWEDSNRQASHSRENNAAIVEGNRAIYFGEQLLAPENFGNEDVRTLLGNALNYLYNMKASVSKSSPTQPESQDQVSGRDQTERQSENGFDPVVLAGVGLFAVIAGYIFLS